MILNENDINNWEEECISNGYLHIVQKTINKNHTVGIKNYHILYAEKLNISIMIHLCPKFISDGKLSNATYKDQNEIMIIKPNNFYNLNHNCMAFEIDNKGNYILDNNGNKIIKTFPLYKNYKNKCRILWILNNFSKYQVWHYKWLPDWKINKGFINKESNIEDFTF